MSQLFKAGDRVSVRLVRLDQRDHQVVEFLGTVLHLPKYETTHYMVRLDCEAGPRVVSDSMMRKVQLSAPQFNFKVYKRKIHVHVKWDCDGKYHYMCSTHAYPTCKAARAGVAGSYELPIERVKASFAK